jgi:ABC-type maltose transport system permease subunit
MKNAHKIILPNMFQVLLIVALYSFIYQTLDLMLAKLRFLEISEGNFEKVEGNYTGDQTLATYPF